MTPVLSRPMTVMVANCFISTTNKHEPGSIQKHFLILIQILVVILNFRSVFEGEDERQHENDLGHFELYFRNFSRLWLLKQAQQWHSAL